MHRVTYSPYALHASKKRSVSQCQVVTLHAGCTLTELKVVVPVMVHYDHDAKWEPRESIP